MARCRRQFGRDRIRDLSISKLLLTGDQSRPAHPLQGLESIKQSLIAGDRHGKKCPKVVIKAVCRPRPPKVVLQGTVFRLRSLDFSVEAAVVNRSLCPVRCATLVA
jgi:hypothetical protein